MLRVTIVELRYYAVEFRGNQGVWTREFTAFCLQWIRLVGVPQRHILERIT